MDAQQLLQEFLASEHGQGARDALAAQGIPDDQVAQHLATAAEVAHAHVQEQGAGLLGAHPGRNFFAALTSGLVKGDGLWGSIKDGLEGVLGGRLTEAIANKAGLDNGAASTIAATLTPYLTSFLKNKLGS